MLANYLPVLIFLIVARCSRPCCSRSARHSAATSRATATIAEKLSPYECGFDPFEDTRMKFDVRYYLVAIVFIVFDLEIAFLFPWAVMFSKLPPFAWVSMGIFLCILVVGFIYDWKKGALDWD